MKYYYVALFSPRPDGAGYDCQVPDLPHCFSFGQDLPQALAMIQDAAALMLVGYEDVGAPIPPAADPLSMQKPEGGFAPLLSLDTDAYRRQTDTAPVRKSVSIPAWMDKLARQRGISCSQVLQEALRQRLGE